MARSRSALSSYVIAAFAAVLAAAAAVQAKTELLVFSSPFCGPCQQLKPTIAEFERQGYPVRQVDVTQHPALASQHRVSRVPCLVMVNGSRELARQLGGDRASIERMFAAAGVRPTQAARNPGPQWANTPDPPTLPARPVSQASRTVPVEPATSPDAFATRLLESSVRITINDATGTSYGTGTIIDTREGDALVVTCGHLFRGESANGEVVIERFKVTPTGLEVVDRTRGQLESYDLDRDVGLVSFRPQSAVQVIPVAAQFAERVNDRVWSVGCDRGAKPTVRDSRVTDIDRYHGPPNIETSGAPVQGRSGGGLFNGRGELIGICFAADTEGDEGLYSGLASVHAELDGLGLQAIYRKAASDMAVAEERPRNLAPLPSTAALDSIVRGQDPASSAASLASFPPRPEAITPTSLPEVERAGLAEIARRAAESEVVVIIRPRETGGESEVIKLDRVSPQFIQALRSMPQ